MVESREETIVSIHSVLKSMPVSLQLRLSINWVNIVRMSTVHGFFLVRVGQFWQDFRGGVHILISLSTVYSKMKVTPLIVPPFPFPKVS